MSSALASEGRRLLRGGGAGHVQPEARPFGTQPPWDAHLSRPDQSRGMRGSEEPLHRPRRPSHPQVVRLSSISEDETQPADGDPLQTGFADFESFFANSRQTRMLDVSGRARPHSYRGRAPAPRKRRLSVSSLASIEENEEARPSAGRRSMGNSPANLSPSLGGEDDGDGDSDSDSDVEGADELPQSRFSGGRRQRDDLSVPSQDSTSVASVASQPARRPRYAPVAGRRRSPHAPAASASGYSYHGGSGPVSPLVVPGSSPLLRPHHAAVDTTCAPPPAPGSVGTPTGAPTSPGTAHSTPSHERAARPSAAGTAGYAPPYVASEQGSAGDDDGGYSQQGSTVHDSLDLLLLPPFAPQRQHQSSSRPTSRVRPGDGLMAAARASLGSQRSRVTVHSPPRPGPGADLG